MVWSGYVIFLLPLFTVISVLIWSGTTVLSQFKKQIFRSDLDQRYLFRPNFPVINGNYGTYLHDTVLLGTLYYINTIVKAEKMPTDPKRCKSCGWRNLQLETDAKATDSETASGKVLETDAKATDSETASGKVRNMLGYKTSDNRSNPFNIPYQRCTFVARL